MTIRLYFSKKPEGCDNVDGSERYLGETLNQDTQGYYVNCAFQGNLRSVPRKGVRFFTAIDYHRNFGSNKRETGIYRHGHATAEVDVMSSTGGNGNQYHQKISGESRYLNSLVELIGLIKAGQIRPDISHEESQIPSPVRP